MGRHGRLTTAWVVAGLLGCAEGFAQSAPPPPGPVIRSVTLRPDTGTLILTGQGFGPDLVVTVDGQTVTTFHATSTQVEAQAPASVLTIPGTYRLTVVDPVRRAWDGFVVASAPVAAVGAVPAAVPPADDARREVPGPTAADAPPHAARASASADVSPRLVEGGSNTAVGQDALTSVTTGNWNVGAGRFALTSNTDGDGNTAAGYGALRYNTTGSNNAAVGLRAMESGAGDENAATGWLALADNDGNYNTATGALSLRLATAANHNTATGRAALFSTTGNDNTALGSNAGEDATTGNYNLFLGAQVVGTSSDTNTIRIGLPFSGNTGQNATYIAGVRGTTVGATNELVVIDGTHRLGTVTVAPQNWVNSTSVVNESLTASDLAATAVGTSELADDAVTPAKVAFNYAGSASEGGAATDVACTGCVSATDVGFSFASLSANTFAGTQAITAGHLDLAPSTATEGNLTKNGVRFLHNTGTRNTFLGASAGNFTLSGADNTAGGNGALVSLTSGASNTAYGAQTLVRNTSGIENTGIGSSALTLSTTGSRNSALGTSAGANATTGSDNIFVGAGVVGAAADANTMRLGLPYDGVTGAGQNKTFLAGVTGTVLTTPAVQVFIDANGQLGTLVPSPIVGTVSGGVTPGGEPQVDALQRQLDEQRLVNAELRTRLAKLEEQMARQARRR